MANDPSQPSMSDLVKKLSDLESQAGNSGNMNDLLSARILALEVIVAQIAKRMTDDAHEVHVWLNATRREEANAIRHAGQNVAGKIK